ncbi:hypothetical protein xavtCFBP7764_20035 [Xanthomonas citri]|nr:hypothetical protein xavtCFBP7764_20035 [Xanthomonas citri]
MARQSHRACMPAVPVVCPAGTTCIACSAGGVAASVANAPSRGTCRWRPGWIRVARRGAFAYPDAIAAAAVVSSADLGHHRVPV